MTAVRLVAVAGAADNQPALPLDGCTDRDEQVPPPLSPLPSREGRFLRNREERQRRSDPIAGRDYFFI